MSVCTFAECGRRATSVGLCQSHNRQMRAGKPLRPIEQRGFAVSARDNPDAFRAMASAAGKLAHKVGAAHQFQPGAEARNAGRRGGTASAKTRAAKAEAQG